MDINAWSSKLMDHVYASMLGESSWEEFLAEFRTPFPNARATLFVHDPNLLRGASAIASGFEENSLRDYAAYYSGLNPWMEPLDRRPVGQAIVADWLFPRSDLVRTEFYSDWLRPQELRSGYGLTILKDGATQMMISVLHSGAPEGLDAPVTSALNTLYPHLRRAFDCARRASVGGNGFSGHRALVDALNVGVFYISADRRVLFQNRRATELLQSQSGIGLDRSGRFTVSDRDCMASIIDLLIWARSWDRPIVRGGVIRRASEERPLQVVMLRPARSAAEAFFQGSFVILLVSDPGRRRRSVADTLAMAYRLTRTERKLVEALVGGSKLKDIARSHDVSLETVRSQLKSILGKTGLHGQSDVIEAVLTSPTAYLRDDV